MTKNKAMNTYKITYTHSVTELRTDSDGECRPVTWELDGHVNVTCHSLPKTFDGMAQKLVTIGCLTDKNDLVRYQVATVDL